MPSEVDLVIAGHSHSRLDIRVPNADGSGDKLIVEALSYGIAYDLVDLAIDKRTGDVVAKSGRVPATPHDVAGDGSVAGLVEKYRTRIARSRRGYSLTPRPGSHGRAGSWAGSPPMRSVSSRGPTPRS
jgi:2',3'-cyclic-nucleotide 2'-phosphodiesterase (5'-nucleotidase family)